MADDSSSMPSLNYKPKIAVVGCGHGQLDTIYAALEVQCALRSWTLDDIDLLIICGDFQAIRNAQDLNCMSVPAKYRHMGDFYRYYNRSTVAPVLTIVIGGNHEASNHLFELYHGGWLAPNIYYLGAAGVLRYGALRIAGLSGIYPTTAPEVAEAEYFSPHHERLPYRHNDIRSVYHIRSFDVARLSCLASSGGSGLVDIGLSHDWPAWVELFGDYTDLYAARPPWFSSARNGSLGSPPAARLMSRLRPSYWFSGHMHYRFATTVDHPEDESQEIEETVRQLEVTDAIRVALPVFSQKKQTTPSVVSDPASAFSTTRNKKRNTSTQFLGLSKPSPNITNPHQTNSYMSLHEIDPLEHDDAHLYTTSPSDKPTLHYDEEWLAIIRASSHLLRLTDPKTRILTPGNSIPHNDDGSFISTSSIAEHREWIRENVTEKGLLSVPPADGDGDGTFVPHAPPHKDPSLKGRENRLPPEYPNLQTARFAELLGIPNAFAISMPQQR